MFALQRLDQRGFLAADVRARAVVDVDVDVETRTAPFLPRYPAAYASSRARSSASRSLTYSPRM